MTIDLSGTEFVTLHAVLVDFLRSNPDQYDMNIQVKRVLDTMNNIAKEGGDSEAN